MKLLKIFFLVFLVAQVSACGTFMSSKPPEAAKVSVLSPTPEQTFAVATSGDNRVFFDYNKSTLNDLDKAKLNKVTVFLKAHPKQALTLKGHIDKIEEFNTTLAQARLAAVAGYLALQGIDQKRIALVNESYHEPLEFGCTDALKDDKVCAVNRRVLLSYS